MTGRHELCGAAGKMGQCALAAGHRERHSQFPGWWTLVVSRAPWPTHRRCNGMARFAHPRFARFTFLAPCRLAEGHDGDHDPWDPWPRPPRRT